MSNISENLFQAIDILMSSKMHDMKYDKTVLCKIENSPNKEKGEYIVTDGSSKFVAYSENTSYQDGASVYVTIPGGDYNNRKLIAGRYVEDNGEYFTYRAPFEDYLDITENLIEDDLSVASLLANGPTKEITLWSRNFEQEREEKREESGQEDYVGIGKGYQTLGINAKFRSWLGALSPVSGDFGLRLDVVGRETATSKTEATEKYYSFYLTTDDMFGNVYNFETYYTQEKIFDISMIDEIARLQLVFYQDADFIDKAGALIPTKDGNVQLPDNIFVSEPYVSFGYSLDTFTEDTLLLYSFDSLTYSPQASPEKNEKRLMARWIHFQEDGQVLAIDKPAEIPADAKLHWYKFILTEGVTDELAGNFWEEIAEPPLLNQLYYKFNPDIAKQNEKFKIIVEYPSREKIQKEIDDGLAVIDANQGNYGSPEARETFILEQQSRIKYIYSPVFTFENEVACVNDATVDLIQGLQIICDPKEKGGLQGNYCIYDMTNELLNPTEGRKIRQLEATYKSLVTGEESLDKAASITWKIPIANTMIYLPEEGIEYFTKVDEEAGEIPDEISRDGTFLYITRRGTENYDVDPEVTELQIEVLQNFRIKSYYTQNATNNTIYCSITKNNRVYEASTTLAFGPMGTNGTDVTLIPTLADNASAIMRGQSLNVDAKLYDYENKEIPIEKIEWSWWSSDDNIELTNATSNPCTITASKEGPIYHNILCAKVVHNDINLEAFLPIPVKSSENVKYAEVPSRVVYDANGSNAAYYKNPMTVIKTEDDSMFAGYWKMVLRDTVTGNAKYYPYVKETADGVKMIPPSMFLNDLDRGVTLIFNSKNEFWYQPILIIQNRWPSAMLNSWDGSLTIDEKNGTILSTMVGAGKKESDNTYTGVLMGDVESGSGDKTVKKTGVYGYNHGMQSFGFMDDGTAFIGKMGKGRIVFDGNEGRITSMSRSQNKEAGMLIDLDDGYIDILGVEQGGVTGTNGYFSNPTYKESGAHVRIDVKDPYLTITTAAKDGHLNSRNVNVPSEIMHVGVGEYFLQSADYSTSPKIGTRFDIADGVYTSYDSNGSGSFVKIDSNPNQPFLQIHYNKKASPAYDTDLLLCGQNRFFLQSPQYEDNKKGMKIDLINSSITAYDKDGSGSFVKINASNSTMFQIQVPKKGSTNTLVPILNVGQNSFYLRTSDYDTSAHTGMEINLQSGRMTAYDFNITAYKSDGRYININSAATSNPFNVNGKFTIDWNGSFQSGGGNFKVSAAGKIEAGSYFVVDPTAKTTKIGPFYVTSTSLYKGTNALTTTGVYLGTAGLGVSSGKFKVDSSGNVTLNGTINGNKWEVDADGKASFENIDATGGKIGNWEIEANGLKGTNLFLNGTNGYIQACDGARAYIDMDDESIWIRGNVNTGWGDAKQATLTCRGEFKSTSTATFDGDVYVNNTLFIKRNGANDKYVDIVTYINEEMTTIWDKLFGGGDK